MHDPPLKIGDRVEVQGREVCGWITLLSGDSARVIFEDNDGYGWYDLDRIRRPVGRSKPWSGTPDAAGRGGTDGRRSE